MHHIALALHIYMCIHDLHFQYNKSYWGVHYAVLFACLFVHLILRISCFMNYYGRYM